MDDTTKPSLAKSLVAQSKPRIGGRFVSTKEESESETPTKKTRKKKVAEEAINEDGSFNTSALIGFNANLVVDTYEGKSYIKDVTPVKKAERFKLEIEDYDHDKFFKEKE